MWAVYQNVRGQRYDLVSEGSDLVSDIILSVRGHADVSGDLENYFFGFVKVKT